MHVIKVNETCENDNGYCLIHTSFLASQIDGGFTLVMGEAIRLHAFVMSAVEIMIMPLFAKELSIQIEIILEFTRPNNFIAVLVESAIRSDHSFEIRFIECFSRLFEGF